MPLGAPVSVAAVEVRFPVRCIRHIGEKIDILETDGELNDDTTAADLLQDHKASISALERLAGSNPCIAGRENVRGIDIKTCLAVKRFGKVMTDVPRGHFLPDYLCTLLLPD